MRPGRGEAADYYFKYIELVDTADICGALATQRDETLAFLRSIPPAQGVHRYAPDKWSVNGVLSHINDCERMFTFRALWFARGFDSPLPSFDQDIAASHDAADARSLQSHIDEFISVRSATLDFFRHLPDDAWTRRGIASDNPFTVRALAFITAGHVTHHARILKERYL
jgi:uncharacterized damage-inducible protein DinB